MKKYYVVNIFMTAFIMSTTFAQVGVFKICAGKNIGVEKLQGGMRFIPQYDQGDMNEITDTLNLRINVEGGYSYRIAKVSENIPPGLKEYADKLKSGFNVAANISYFLGVKSGLCLNYNRFSTSNSMSVLYDGGAGKMEDNITISYFGMGLAVRDIFNNGKIFLIANISMGYCSYNNDGKLIYPIQIEGSTYAYSGLLNLDFMVSRNWALGFGISYLGGTLKDATVNGQSANLGEENLSRLDFNAGVRYYY